MGFGHDAYEGNNTTVDTGENQFSSETASHGQKPSFVYIRDRLHEQSEVVTGHLTSRLECAISQAKPNN